MPSLLEVIFPLALLVCIRLGLLDLADSLLRYGAQVRDALHSATDASHTQLYISSKL